MVVPVDERARVAASLVRAGLREIECASFVNPTRVPQMFGAERLIPLLPDLDQVAFSALALNGRGVERAVDAGVQRVTVVTSASQAHSSANASRSIDRALDDFAPVIAAHPEVHFSAGISTAFLCPFEGEVAPDTVVGIARRFVDMGVGRIGLADTIGTASPHQVVRTSRLVQQDLPDVELSLHLHNAHGQALRSVDAALEVGITHFESAAGGYGGCPFAPGAHGNLATENLVEHLHSHGVTTGIDGIELSHTVRLLREILARAQPVSTSDTSSVTPVAR